MQVDNSVCCDWLEFCLCGTAAPLALLWLAYCDVKSSLQSAPIELFSNLLFFWQSLLVNLFITEIGLPALLSRAKKKTSLGQAPLQAAGETDDLRTYLSRSEDTISRPRCNVSAGMIRNGQPPSVTSVSPLSSSNSWCVFPSHNGPHMGWVRIQFLNDTSTGQWFLKAGRST